MKNRLIELLKKENLTATKFADIIGVQRSSISHILSGRNKPSYDFIEKTLNKFPDINPEWLILGKGNVYKETDKFDESKMNNILNKKNDNIDLFSDIKKIDNNIKSNNNLQTSKIDSEKLKVTNVNNEEIERIVIFYNDNSFSEYKAR